MSSNSKKFSVLFSSILALYMMTGQAQAATVSLTPQSPSVALGDQVILQLNMDFGSDDTLGGGFDVFYNHSLISFTSFTFNSGWGDDPGYHRQPDLELDKLNGIAFGNFGGIGGAHMVGTFVFNTLGAGPANFTLAENDAPTGGFFSARTFGPQAVTYSGASVNVTSVPLPAAGWLLLSGLGVLGGLRKETAV